MASTSPFDLFLQSPIAAGIAKDTERVLRREGRAFDMAPRERAPMDRVTFIADGHAKLVAVLPNAQEHVVRFAWPGTLALHQPGDGGAVIALDHCSILAFPPISFFEIMNADRAAANNLSRELEAQLHALRLHAAVLARLSARERIITFLDRLGRERGVKEGGRIRLRLPMSRADIADHLGLTIETTSRCMMQLQRSGLVSCPSRREVAILLPEELKI